jgi:hypothetical protein
VTGPAFTLALTEAKARFLIEALDSHEYWQLSDEQYRDSGYVHDPGSDDPERAEEIEFGRQLVTEIEEAMGTQIPRKEKQ